MPAPVVDLQEFDRCRAAIAKAAAGALLSPDELRAVFGIRRALYYKLQREHAFDQFRVHPPIGPKCYSGELITKYLKGTPVYGTPSIKRSRSRR